jgi:two-component sensor histidine kinase
MEESAQTFRGHMQRAISLLNLHIQYQEGASNPDFLKKLRMRMELMAEALPLALEGSEREATMAETFAAVEQIVSRIYDPDGGNACDYALGGRSVDQPVLATLGQIFAEFLSNIYSRATPGSPSLRVEVTFSADAASEGRLRVRDAAVGLGAQTEPLDQLTSRVIGELARSLDGAARFDGPSIHDAELTFPLAPSAIGSR